jgi:hypothetical protein
MVVNYGKSMAIYGVISTKRTLCSMKIEPCLSHHISKWPEFHECERMHTLHVFHAKPCVTHSHGYKTSRIVVKIDTSILIVPDAVALATLYERYS